jgi:hypothetical protein
VPRIIRERSPLAIGGLPRFGRGSAGIFFVLTLFLKMPYNTSCTRKNDREEKRANRKTRTMTASACRKRYAAISLLLPCFRDRNGTEAIGMLVRNPLNGNATFGPNERRMDLRPPIFLVFPALRENETSRSTSAKAGDAARMIDSVDQRSYDPNSKMVK